MSDYNPKGCGKRIEPNPQQQIRQGWDIAARAMHAKGDDKLLIDDALTDKNTDWWTWDE